MNLKEQDDLAKLAFGLSRGVSKQEGKEAVAAMYGVDLDRAWALIVRGKNLVAASERRAG
jgi:ribosomal protein L23